MSKQEIKSEIKQTAGGISYAKETTVKPQNGTPPIVSKLNQAALKAYYKGPTADPIDGLNLVVLKASDVKRDRGELNSRQDYKVAADPEKLEPVDFGNTNLHDSIRAQGFTSVLRVSRNVDKSYSLTWGNRRLDALIDVAGDKDVLCLFTVQQIVAGEDEKTTALRRLFDNITENVSRKNIKPWELAESLCNAAELGAKSTEIAKMTGLSGSHVDNMMRLKRKLHPDIWKKYKAAPPGEYSLPFLLSVASLEPDKQLEKFAVGDDGKEKAKANKGAGSAQPPLRAAKEVHKLLAGIKKFGLSDPESGEEKGVFWKGAVWALMWAISSYEVYETDTWVTKKKEFEEWKKAQKEDAKEE